MRNSRFDEEIRILLNKYHRNYSGVFGTKNRKYLLDYINDSTPLLQDSCFTITTKLFWLINGISKFPICEECGKDITRNVTSLQKGYRIRNNDHLYCSISCASSSQYVNEKRKQTSVKRYGYENPNQSDIVKQKIRATNLEKYSCECVFQNEEIKDKIRITKEELHGDPHWTNIEKQAKTNIQRYGCVNVFSSKIIQDKIKHTNLDKYGHKNPMQNEAIQHQAQSTTFECYGSQYTVTADSIKQKIKNMMLERYDSPSFFGSDAFREYSIKEYGTEYPCQNGDIRNNIINNRRTKLIYDSKYFDSQLELALFLFLQDMGLQFEYQCTQRFEFKDIKGKTHIYIPDFKIGDAFVELKGSHFFKQDGSMFCPFRNRDWTDEYYQYVCSIYESKHQCMLNNSVIIVRSDSICAKTIKNYVHKKYGKGYLESFFVK